jgi:phosphoserine phosphatase
MEYLTKQINYACVVDRTTNLFARAVKGINEVIFQQYEDDFFQKQGRLYMWVSGVLDFLYENNYEIILLLATVEPILDTFARFLPVTQYFGSELEIENDIFTGRINSILNGDFKKRKLREILETISSESFSISFGDSVGDIPMLKSTDLSFVINPHSEKIIESIRKYRWNVTIDGQKMIELIKKHQDK